MDRRFSRTELLIGREGLSRLAAARVCVFGLGGVGSFAAEALCRAGVGGFILVDSDVVDVSNINRQLHALDHTVGSPKVELMARRMAGINPSAGVHTYFERLKPGEEERFLKPGPDYVVDAIDDVTAKVELLKYCVTKGVPVVSSMGAGNKLDPAAFKVADISETSVCPLARAVRRRLRQEGVERGIKVVYSTEKPMTSGAGGGGDHGEKSPPGSISFVPPVAGLILAGLVVTDLLHNKKPF
ncbi:HesA/MoeB/ThiF family protein [Desulfocucumis palustris]|uniref:HesA/MoeB/ThiF family protein n=1 Tax=Desulfocucumis palustris TaxID=1898651 RepID=A0A2L2XK21_9FIRM|nr:tRNA threonylcarbamoyladenosine dehydratase [Desulfocucumis palustris]GBF34261.1 HesA/MoeB/ThiF family protein [Desulfocucumis palustris]